MTKYLRYSAISFFVIIGFLIIFFRLFYLTVIEKPSKNSSQTEKIQTMRGFIYSADRTLLALSLKTYSLYINPKEMKIKDKEKYLALFEILNIPQKLKEEIVSQNKSFIWLKRFLENTEIQALEEKDLLKASGVYLAKEYKRYYPQKNTASHSIGFVGIDGNGLAGIEYSMDKWLTVSSDLLPLWEKENILGKDLVLTLSIPLQKAVEEELYLAYQRTLSKSITAIVMEAETGDILALANYPDFDPNQFKNYKNNEIFKNLAISHIDEPGSTFKPLVMSFLLDNQKMNIEEEFYCKGQENIGEFTIRDEKIHGRVNARKIIAYSCNIGMALLGQRLTRQELYQLLTRYHFGSLTGIELPGEEKGIIRSPQKMTLRSKISIPIGQEIGITPIQLVAAYTVLANQGTYVYPRIVKEIEYNGKIIEKFLIRKDSLMFKKETIQTMLSYLRDVVLVGTGKDANIPGVWIGGKTGTAQIFDINTQSYSKVNTSFIAILKHPNGKNYILYAVLRNPRIEEASGGKLAAPIVRNIAIKLLQIIQ